MSEQQARASEQNAIESRKAAEHSASVAQQQRDLAESQAFASDARREMVPELKNALTMSVRAFQKSPSIDAQMALLETLSRAAKVKRYFLCNSGEKATGVAFSRDLDPLIAYSCTAKGFTRIIMVDTQGHVHDHAKVSGDGRSFAFIDRGHLGIGGSRDLRILTIANGRIDTYHGHSAEITSVASGMDSQFFSADAVGEIRLWKLTSEGSPGASPSEVLKKVGFAPITNLVYGAKTGTLLVAGYSDQSDTIQVNEAEVDPVNQAAVPPSTTENDCGATHPLSNRYRALAIASDGSALAYSTELNDIVVIDPKTKLCEAILSGHTHNILSMAFSPNGEELASAGAIADADDTHGIILWNLKQVHPLATRLPLTGAILRNNSKIALSAKSVSWACIYCGSTVVWDGKPISLPKAVAENSLSSIALAQDGNELALGFVKGTLLFIEKRHPDEFIIGKISDSGIQRLWFADNLYAVSQDATVSVWSHGHRIPLMSKAKIPENDCRDSFTWGPYLPLERNVGTNNVLVLYDVGKGKDEIVATLPSTADVCSSAAYFGGSGAIIRLSANYAPIYLVSANPRPQVDGWENPVHDPSGLRTQLGLARVSQDGSLLFATSNGNSLVLFDLTSRRLIGNIELHGIRDVQISSDGKRAVTASIDGILMWNFNPEAWMQAAIQISGGESTVDRH